MVCPHDARSPACLPIAVPILSDLVTGWQQYSVAAAACFAAVQKPIGIFVLAETKRAYRKCFADKFPRTAAAAGEEAAAAS